MIAPARLAAWRILRAVHGGSRTLPDALADIAARLDDERDRALTAEIVTGTLRWRGALDHIVSRAARRPLDRIDPDVLDALRIGAYQIIHLDRIPARAIVGDAAELARRGGKASAVGFVNAVLRRLAERPLPALPPRPVPPGGASAGDPQALREAELEYLSVTLSHPRWLVARWLSRMGFDAVERWCAFDNERAPITLRANTLHAGRDALADALAAEGVATEPTRFAPQGLTVTRGYPLRTRLAATGAFLVQDEASQLVAHVAGARPGQHVLDACASPGGKTVALAAAMAGRGLLVACDVRDRRVRLLAGTLRQAGAAGVRIVQADIEQGAPFAGESFACVLVDAPCSGLGTIRRDPEIRWRRAESDLARFADRQLRLLRAAASVVRPGGRLVYATCSPEPEENEEVIEAFLRGTDFTLVDLRREDPGGRLAPLLDARGCLRTLPPLHGLEAFVAAVLERPPRW